MRHYTELATYDREGFEVIVDITNEDLHPRDCFETDDVEEIVRKIADGTYEWFMMRVRVMFDGHELGSSYLGGCCYENASDVLTDGTAEDFIFEAMKEAKHEALELKHKLVELNLEEII